MSQNHPLRLLIESDSRAHGGRIVLFVRSLQGADDLRVSVPLGEPTTVELSEGQYLLEALLPSGERLRRPVDVPAQSTVTLRPSSSPHEWLGFQHLFLPPRRLRTHKALESTHGLPTEPRVYLLHDWPTSWKGAGLNEQVRSRTPLQVDPKSRLSPTAHDSATYRFDIPRITPMTQGRGAVVVALKDRVKAVPVAHDWLDLRTVSSTTELVVNAERQSISTTILDPVFAPVLAYLSSGRADLAATSLDQLPMELLLGKLANPYAATAGAYVLIDQLQDADRFPVWRGWIRNLANWFPWLPDGALLEGRALQHTERPEAALEHFLEAFDRGIPFFAEGIRILLEGLLSFSDEDFGADKAARLATATRAVRQWANWLDPRESFTTLNLSIPVHEEQGSTSLELKA